MTIHAGLSWKDLCHSDMRFATDLDLIMKLAEQAAQGALIKEGVCPV